MSLIRSTLAVAALVVLASPLRAADPPYHPAPADDAALQQALALGKTDHNAAMNAVVALRDAHPTWPAPLTAQGLLYFSVNDFGLAKNAFRAALEIDPVNHDALLYLASTNSLLHQTAEAVAALNRLFAANPADGEVALRRAQALIANHQKPEAAKFLATLVAALKPADRAGALTLIVPLQLQADDFANANTSATQWTVAAPDSADAFAYRADAHRGLQQFEDAAADLQHAIALSHNRPTFPILFVASQLHLSQGDTAAAITQLVDLLELAPANAEVEAAISVAVAAHQSQLLATPTPPDNLLIPRVNFDGAVQKWELRNAVHRELIRTQLDAIHKAQSLGNSPPPAAIASARAKYPAPEVYAAALRAHAQFSLDNPRGVFPSPTDNAQAAIIEARVAAAVAALHYARHMDGDAPNATLAPGYIAWADFQQHLLDHTPSPADKLLLAAHALEQSHDIPAALDAYLAAEAAFPRSPANPATLMANNILNNPALLHSLIARGVEQIDHLITEDQADQSPALADRLIAFATRSSQNAIVPNPTLATAYIAKAHALRASHIKDKAAQAAKAVADALTADPLSEAAHFLLAKDLHDAGLDEQALLEANMAVAGENELTAADSHTVVSAFTLRTTLESSRIAARQTLYAKAGDAAYKNENWALAYACASRLQDKSFPAAGAGAYVIAGISALNLARHEDAVKNFTAAMALDPKRDLHAQLAEAHAALHHFQLAIDQYDATLKLAPKDLFALRGRANAYLQLPNYRAAAADFQTLIDNNYSPTDILLARADALSHTDTPAAIAAYKVAIDKLAPLELFPDLAAQLLQAKARLFLLQLPPG